MNKKLTRSKSKRVIAGVLGGVAEYFNIDPTIVRLLFVIGLFLSLFFPLSLIYVAAMFIMPSEQGTL